jgi:hypothetical protein
MTENSHPLSQQSVKQLGLAIKITAVGVIIFANNKLFFENIFVQGIAMSCFVLAIVFAFLDLSKNGFASVLHHLIFGTAASFLALSIQLGIVWFDLPIQGTFLHDLFRFGLGNYLLVVAAAVLVSVGTSSIVEKKLRPGNLLMAIINLFTSFVISFTGYSNLM